MRRVIHLHGTFAKYHDGPIEIVTDTIHAAIEAITRMLPGFAPDPIMGMQKIMVAGIKSREDLLGISDMVDVHIFPALTFGKNMGLIQTVIGVTLMVISFFFIGLTNPFGASMFTAGLMSVMGGLMQMLAPQPKASSADMKSRYISVTQNTVLIGTPIPILYGRYKVGGQILSLSVTSQNQSKSQ